MRYCVLGFGDEVCVYHRERKICDISFKVGLHILKVQPVESINNPCLRYVYRTRDRDSLVVFHGSFDPAFGIAFTDIGAAIVLFFPFANREFELHKSPLTIQANGDQSQAFGSRFSDECGDVTLMEKELPGAGIFMGNFLSGMTVAGDEGIGKIKLTTVDGDKGAFEARVAGFDALYLGAGQDNTSLIVVLEAVIKPGSSVVSDDFHGANMTQMA